MAFVFLDQEKDILQKMEGKQSKTQMDGRAGASVSHAPDKKRSKAQNDNKRGPGPPMQCALVSHTHGTMYSSPIRTTLIVGTKSGPMCVVFSIPILFALAISCTIYSSHLRQ